MGFSLGKALGALTGSVAIGYLGSNASKASSNAKAAANPYAAYQGQAVGQLEALMGGDLSSITNSPTYQAQVQQATQSVNRQSAASGMYDSGNRLSNLTSAASSIASQDFTQQFNLLSALSGNAQYSPQMMQQLYSQQSQLASGAAGGLLSTVPGIGGALGSLSGFM